MHLRSRLALPAALLIIAIAAAAQGTSSNFPNYASGSQELAATPGTYGGAAGAYWNPAAWAAMNGWDATFAWNDRNLRNKTMDDWGLFLGGHGLGFAMQRNTLVDTASAAPQTSFIEDYQLGLGGGDPEMYWGLAYGWSRGRTDWANRDQYVSLGSLYRPVRYLSIGAAANMGLTEHDRRLIGDVGVRPLGMYKLTLFADAALGRFDTPNTMQWGAGVEVRPIDGVRLAFKMTKPDAEKQDKILSVSLGLAMNNLGFHVIPHYDKDSNRLSTSYVLRCSELEPDLKTHSMLRRGEDVVTKSMRGAMVYRKARWFDVNRQSFYDVINMIQHAKEDKAVGGIALNLSGMDASRELLWEVREKLADFKSSGKKVYIYFDRVGMASYYFASIADYLWMDPQGNIALPGYVAGRTFYKGFFEKLGLGVEEWRFFTYKSAFESFARKDMSAADKEQRLALIQDFYDVWSRDIAASRNMTTEHLRTGIDTMGYFTADEALAFGLVDSIGAWDDVRDFIEMKTGKDPSLINEDAVQAKNYPDPEWGKAPEIALVYLAGDCDMDTGIKGRLSSRVIRKLGRNDNVKAIVIRADSPGGDPLPSDLVARQMKEIRERKPVIVSQGDVAASGGYWISMRSDRIFASPFTITGSIGVIGGWIWNDGFSNKTGFTSDHVMIGKHADLGFGVRVPLLGVQIPDRNLDQEEHDRMERLIRGTYADFTKQVAESRGLEQTYVDSVGQGRAWSGTRGLEVKLVDEIGTMENALTYAKRQTHLDGKRVNIVEYPRREWMNLGGLTEPTSPIGLLTRLLGKDTATPKSSEYELHVLEKIGEHRGQPLLMVPPEDLPAEE
jgi:protease-4